MTKCARCKKPVDSIESKAFDGHHFDCYEEREQELDLDPETVEQVFNHNRNGGNSGQFKRRTKNHTTRRY